VPTAKTKFNLLFLKDLISIATVGKQKRQGQSGKGFPLRRQALKRSARSGMQTRTGHKGPVMENS